MNYQVKCVDFDAPFVELPKGSIVVSAEAVAKGDTLEKYSKEKRYPEELYTNPEIWRITYLEPVNNKRSEGEH